MTLTTKNISKTNIIQWIIFLFINCIFVFKYSQRTSISPYLSTAIYVLFIILVYNITNKITKLNYKYATITLLLCVCILISLILIKVDPPSVNVDRWSATTYFLDGLFSGIYPYGIHTHVSEYNFPSPFPLWHYINIPFWLLGDVGIGLFAFLLLFVYSVFKFTQSYKKVFFILLLLSISPAYWWEIVVRSDGLSNQILIFSVLIFMYKKNISFDNHMILSSVIAGFCACTRLSAIIPIGIYLLNSYIRLSLNKKIFSIALIALVVFVFFIPYIFWNIDNWIFFNRNPFMSQSTPANVWILITVSAITIAFTLHNKNNDIFKCLCFTSIIMIVFFTSTMIYFHISSKTNISIWNDADFDISYLTLSLPYCLIFLIYKR